MMFFFLSKIEAEEDQLDVKPDLPKRKYKKKHKTEVISVKYFLHCKKRQK